ncbi:MAG TPA: DUF3108 domain-containing protein [Ramlibacter sp.]|nr:DUF3108 domain-containing protein [Ramlibacter sp.]
MAGIANLKAAGAGPRLALLLALVLVVHMLALAWLQRQLELSAVLRPMATPMFTRLLTPEAPAAPPQQVAQPAPKPRRSSVTAIARPAAVVAENAASAPEPKDPSEVSDVELGPIRSAPAQATTTVAAAVPAPAPTAAPAPSSPASAPAPTPVAAASAPAAGSLDSWPADTRLNYRLGGNYRGELHGSARVQWQRQDEKYQTRIDIDLTLFGGIVLTSQGEVTPTGLAPRAYEELRRSGPRVVRMNESAITFNDGRTAPRPAGVQDTASQFVELSHRFSSGLEVLEVGRSVSFWVARPGAVDLWTYDIVEREVLQTSGLGPVEAFHLKPRPIANPRGNITAEMWFAPSLQYLPIRIKVNLGDNAYVDLMVEKIEQR